MVPPTVPAHGCSVIDASQREALRVDRHRLDRRGQNRVRHREIAGEPDRCAGVAIGIRRRDGGTQLGFIARRIDRGRSWRCKRTAQAQCRQADPRKKLPFPGSPNHSARPHDAAFRKMLFKIDLKIKFDRIDNSSTIKMMNVKKR
ncbi:hypothetical protein HFN80_18570 [Rhizobium laguerreae]|uniref:hypothetical protein n=1 Tax=Rhizobium laguerreae TaxID=1076926 RepID=UPI001C90C491|nr:hypothetical protein [Rhizobium laguerreae]MBY3225490.1 hypothetical protein [Rhizobium laguerreae]MBY3383712.1 hypothetical protein [Rhizobium laguerreae]MBY3465981.1 hypothetical protein [Rhizobium laguerreae]